MMTLVDAARVADELLKSSAEPGGVEVVLTRAEQDESGWTFRYQSAAYLRTRAIADVLGGNAPVRVDTDGAASFVDVPVDEGTGTQDRSAPR